MTIPNTKAVGPQTHPTALNIFYLRSNKIHIKVMVYFIKL